MEELLNTILSDPTVADTLIKGIIDKYKPVAYAAAGELFNIYKDFVNNEEVYEVTARNYRNQYEAFLRVGFNEIEAMTLLLKDIKQSDEMLKNISRANVKTDK